MFTIIGGDGKEYGPAPAAQIRAWIGDGRANLDTQARRAGEDQWRRLGEFPEFNEVAAAEPPPLETTAPAAASAPVAAATLPDITSHAADLFARSGKIDIFACLDAAFNLWKKNLLPLVGVTLLVLAIQLALGFIPIIGSLAGLVLNGVFYGGLYYYYLGKLRGEPRDIGDAFAGFSRASTSLMVGSLLTTLLLVGIMMLFAGPAFIAIVQAGLEAGRTGVEPEIPPLTPLALAGCCVGGLIVFYLSIAWAFVYALVVDQRLGPWTAMELCRRVVSKQWFRVFFILLMGGILAMLGFFGLVVGIVFTLPLAFAAITCAYEALFNPPPKA
ncbi:MAG: DUF4339 domain-containing protein [Opitutaceae bacterium]|nr:DUF4339 domain-containing protein [Opitutaceae bacterium]